MQMADFRDLLHARDMTHSVLRQCHPQPIEGAYTTWHVVQRSNPPGLSVQLHATLISGAEISHVDLQRATIEQMADLLEVTAKVTRDQFLETIWAIAEANPRPEARPEPGEGGDVCGTD